ncbi:MULTISPECIES: TetR/AcrR family transcriptional regulator [unclassified Sphingobium]|uniref:TetR/AcrR family transcriptional regulator n=1 Tax=unclassified Sphingobium TaxID=2611147 RepID=UPI001199E5B4|nr:MULTISPECIES: TetR/AcrR family transcriptional regulator [unclassified Sphingobium]MBG6120091.1 AcrR family transcriptional regulator [Sphingobium sp. JAI105]TWD05708.1 TetR family transcriptional regulator [Sphingobium sp. AEW010]TWD23261.1 TetR family transcriptional regulator [Sphingobium sp. AEW013]TWD25121.1 TetR family transcriptional regulator [Sphingobium sp. AEW001]
MTREASTEVRRGRLPREEADQRVNQLMTLALQEFAACGFGGTSLNRLVDLSGVSKTTIMRRFGNKEGLFLSLLDYSGMDIRDALQSCARGDDARATVERFVETTARFATVELGQALLRLAISERVRFPQLADLAIAHTRVTFQPIADHIDLMMRARLIEPADPMEAAFELVAMVNHGFRMMIDDPAYLATPGRATAITDRFLKGRGYNDERPHRS